MKIRLWLSLLLLALSIPVSAQQVPAGRRSISLPDKSWRVVFDLPGFSVKIHKMAPDGLGYLSAENPDSGVDFSVFLEGTTSVPKAQTCQENLQARAQQTVPYQRTDIKFSTFGEMATLEYLIPEYQGAKVQQQNLFACLLRDGVYIDMHLSKTSFKPGDEKLFQAILQTVKFEEAGERGSMDYVQLGSQYYRNEEYKKAIGPYQKALDLEKEKPSLDKTTWKVLVDNLGMAYGMTGDLEKSKETFEYGISKEPTYPLFYYNMACYYGEKGDAENAAANLKKAFEYKANTLPSETMPDPRQDDSFKKLLKNPDFRKAVEDILKKS